MRVFGGTFSHFRSKRLHNLGDKWGGGISMEEKAIMESNLGVG